MLRMQISHGVVCLVASYPARGKREEGKGGGSAEIGLAFVARFLKTLTSFKPKCLIFRTLFTLGP